MLVTRGKSDQSQDSLHRGLGLGGRVLLLSLGRLSLATRCESSEAQNPPFPYTDQPCSKDLARLILPFSSSPQFGCSYGPCPTLAGPSGTWRGEQAPDDGKPPRLEICRSREQHEQCDPCRSLFFFPFIGSLAGFEL